jgi:hypothetical protein
MSQIPILVISCDKYADIWEPFFSIFWKRWPDCPYPVYLGTNQKTYPDKRVTTITIGDDINWASGVLAMLDQLDCEYFILLLEDFLIKQKVQTDAIERFVHIAIEHNVGNLRLSPLPAPTPLPSKRVDRFPDLGIVQHCDPYRVSTQPAIWKVATLRKLLLSGMTAWEFEEIGSQMSEYIDDIFWGPFKPLIVYDHCIEKGKWKPEGLEICATARVEVDLYKRPAFSKEKLLAHYDAGRLANENNIIKQNSIAKFRIGRRAEGLKLAWRYLNRKPFSIQVWGIILFGILGSRYINWLRKQHIRWKIASIEGRYNHR